MTMTDKLCSYPECSDVLLIQILGQTFYGIHSDLFSTTFDTIRLVIFVGLIFHGLGAQTISWVYIFVAYLL